MNRTALTFIIAALCVPAAYATPSLGTRVFYSQDGRYFIMGQNGSLNIGSANSRKFIKSTSFPDGMTVGVHPDGKRIAMTSFRENSLLYFSMKGDFINKAATPGSVVEISNTFRHLLTCTYKQNASIYTVSAFSNGGITPKYEFADDNSRTVDKADFSYKDRYLAYSYNKLSANGRIAGCQANIISMATGRSAGQLPFPAGDNSCNLKFSADGKLLAFGSSKVRVVSVPDWKLLKTVSTEGKLANVIRFSADGAYMGVLYQSGDVRVYSLPGFAEVFQKYYNENGLDMAFSPDSAALAVVFADGLVKFLDLKRSKPMAQKGR